jgi:two-component system, OmpR family, sensor histidine kinase KdpD
LLLYLSVTVVASALGGTMIGVLTALASLLLTNWFFLPPFHSLEIAGGRDVVSLVVFLAVSLTVSTLVNRVAVAAIEARLSRGEAEALARTTATLVGQPEPMGPLVTQIRSTFGLQAAAVMHKVDKTWETVAASGDQVPATPEQGSVFNLDANGDMLLVVTGRLLGNDDRRMLRVFADQLQVALEAGRLQRAAFEARSFADTDALRTALLRAVSHDLRTPLASIKASVTSLQQRDVNFSDADQAEFLDTINEETDRLNRLVGNLLDMSRLQIGALKATQFPCSVSEVVGAALKSLSPTAFDTSIVTVDIDPEVPSIECDPVLLERALANVVSNAMLWSPPRCRVGISAGSVGDRVHILVCDHGPGIAPSARQAVFEPFQRLGDQANSNGVGLGLAVSKGFVEAMGGTLTIEDTPGGGCTMVIDLAASPTLSASPDLAGAVDAEGNG